MRFQSITFTAIAALSATVYAQDSSQMAAFESDVEAYLTATLIADPAFESVLSEIETNTADLAQIEALTGAGIASADPSQVSSVIAALPTDVRPFFTSVLGVYSSLAIKDGVISSTTGAAASAATASSTSSGAVASATGSAANKYGTEMGILAGSLMGVVGLMAAL